MGGDPRGRSRFRVLREFQSTPPVWGATGHRKEAQIVPRFQSTPPVWGATISFGIFLTLLIISIHAPRVGGDSTGKCGPIWTRNFNPRPPCGGRRLEMGRTELHNGNFNPRPPCGGRRGPRMGAAEFAISIHAPRVGGDLPACFCMSLSCLFQSTPPVWGATFLSTVLRSSQPVFQSTPPVWGATRCRSSASRRYAKFQSTPPVWGATRGARGADRTHHHFNPRPPCGGRPAALWEHAPHYEFQSTPPVWGATREGAAGLAGGAFQSTPPVWGATPPAHRPRSRRSTFQSTPPVWGATDLGRAPATT